MTTHLPGLLCAHAVAAICMQALDSAEHSDVQESNQLTGQVPSLSMLRQLEGIWLRDNGFDGAIPKDWLSTTSLRTVDFSFNRLNGAHQAADHWLSACCVRECRLSSVMLQAPSQGPRFQLTPMDHSVSPLTCWL